MAIELVYLAASVVLGFVYIMAAGAAATKARGNAWNMGPRDTSTPLPPVAGRLDRAVQNFKETFPFFVAAVFLAEVTHSFGTISVIGATLYFWARVVYLPLYALGIPVIRTLVWLASVVGIVMVLLALVVH